MYIQTPKKHQQIPLTSSKPSYSSGASYHDFMGRWSKVLASKFVKLFLIREGASILDVGCGTGSLTDVIARTTKANRIVGIDPTETLLDFANGNNQDDRVSFRKGVGEDLPFNDNSFDSSLALLSLHNVPEPIEAVIEMKRVTRPAGLIAAAEWDFCSGMEMLQILWDTLLEFKPQAFAHHPRQIALGREGDLPRLWQEAGVNEIQSKTLLIPLTFENFDDFYIPMIEGAQGAARIIASLTAEQQLAFIKKLKNKLNGNKPKETPFTLHARAWTVWGRSM